MLIRPFPYSATSAVLTVITETAGREFRAIAETCKKSAVIANNISLTSLAPPFRCC
jgi:hypothetical protein